MEQIVRINPADIPAEVYDMGCRILSKSIRSFFADSKNRRGYEEWMKTPEGQRADLSREERKKYDAEHARSTS
jgi:hypothetical protein